MTMFQRLTTILCCAISTLAIAADTTKDTSGLAYFDPENSGSIKVAAPTAPVDVTIDFNQKTFAVNDKFYGLNSHPLPAEEAFRNPDLVRTLNPDTIRIMVNKRTFWYRDSNNQSKTKIVELSPERGKFNWESIDDLIAAIESFGAEPYVALGFGAPKYLNSANNPRLFRPLAADLPEYADYMATIVKHLRNKNFNVKYVTIDNEPENVGYPIDDYILLKKLATEKIHAVDPAMLIAGPTTGYAQWKQPDNKNMSFYSSTTYLKKHEVQFAAFDWHAYSTNPAIIFKSADVVKEIYPDTPRFLTELNLDWRYSGDKAERSQINNSNWDSVRFLTLVYDVLQQKGVDRVYYFCIRNNFFGLYDYNMTQVRPNYYTFYAFTNLLGRQRVKAVSSHPAIGVIATLDQTGKPAVMLYNLANEDVAVKYPELGKFTQKYTLSTAVYDQIKLIKNGKSTPLAAEKITANDVLTVPAGGWVVLK